MAQLSPGNAFDFSGRQVLVTGGGRGIGLEIVKLFLNLNAEVIVFDKDETLLQKLAHDLPAVKGIKVDLSNWDATKKATEAILPIHHLVNNAVTIEVQDILEINEEAVDRHYAVNFKAALNTSQVVAKGMIQNEIKDGTIVNISSILDTTAKAQTAMYCSTKATIAMLSKNLALELGQYGIQVNYVRPSLVNTELVENLPSEFKDPLIKSFIDRMALKRLPEAMELPSWK